MRKKLNYLLKSDGVVHDAGDVLACNGSAKYEPDGITRVEVTRETGADAYWTSVRVCDTTGHDKLVRLIERSARVSVHGVDRVPLGYVDKTPPEVGRVVLNDEVDVRVLDLTHALSGGSSHHVNGSLVDTV